jgi:hypothetical protein
LTDFQKEWADKRDHRYRRVMQATRAALARALRGGAEGKVRHPVFKGLQEDL